MSLRSSCGAHLRLGRKTFILRIKEQAFSASVVSLRNMLAVLFDKNNLAYLDIYKNFVIKKSARPNALKTAEIIQKRMVTLVSGQPSASK